MVQEIQVKSILNRNTHPSSWFGINYGMNIYRGCQHQCIYCDSRSLCYQIEDFDHDLIVKVNAPELLRRELSRKRKRATIGTGAMSDPYIPQEKSYQLTRQCLKIIEEFRYRIHIVTKSNLLLRDIDLLEKIAKRYACIAFTITTTDDELARQLEPYAPLPSERLQAMGILAEAGIRVGITMMPQLPYIMETQQHIDHLIEAAVKYKAKFIVPSFGVTLRDRQRDYYYKKLDANEMFKELVPKYKNKFGTRYYAQCINHKKMKAEFNKLCKENNISTQMPSYEKMRSAVQMNLFDSWNI